MMADWQKSLERRRAMGRAAFHIATEQPYTKGCLTCGGEPVDRQGNAHNGSDHGDFEPGWTVHPSDDRVQRVHPSSASA